MLEINFTVERYFKYKRIEETLSLPALQVLFDKLIEDGFEIINYSENKVTGNDWRNPNYNVVIVVGKKQSDLKSVL